MLHLFNFVMVEFYDGENHLCELFKTIDDISDLLKVHRSTIYKNYDKDLDQYVINKNKKKYYIKKL
tara:strand:- start:1198 stop:1395 length:198 start_codon:yes stop_codon:yes gene_type:complete